MNGWPGALERAVKHPSFRDAIPGGSTTETHKHRFFPPLKGPTSKWSKAPLPFLGFRGVEDCLLPTTNRDTHLPSLVADIGGALEKDLPGSCARRWGSRGEVRRKESLK